MRLSFTGFFFLYKEKRFNASPSARCPASRPGEALTTGAFFSCRPAPYSGTSAGEHREKQQNTVSYGGGGGIIIKKLRSLRNNCLSRAGMAIGTRISFAESHPRRGRGGKPPRRLLQAPQGGTGLRAEKRPRGQGEKQTEPSAGLFLSFHPRKRSGSLLLPSTAFDFPGGKATGEVQENS